MNGPARIAVVGGGYAGMAAAVELCRAGCIVELFEASRTLGGRARAVDFDGIRLDNGAHILAGAYTETLRLLALVGAADGLRREPLHLEYPDGMRIAGSAWLPAPLHLGWALLAARGLAPGDKLAAARLLKGLQARRFRLARDETVAALLDDQPGPLRRFLWEPLCLATLNTPPDEASAQVFANVLRDTLGAGRAASDLLLPVTDLSALFPEPAARYLQAHGACVHRGRRIASIGRTDRGFFLDGEGPFDQVILAVAPYHVAPLIDSLPELHGLTVQMAGLDWQPIVTCYLRYPRPVALPWPMVGVANGTAQWLFDLGALRHLPGTLAAVISAHGRHQNLSHDALATRIHTEVAAIVPGLPPPAWQQVIAERRATFACTPGLVRPATATAIPGLWLAGDYVASDYPATIEGAVRSGVRAAAAAVERVARLMA